MQHYVITTDGAVTSFKTAAQATAASAEIQQSVTATDKDLTNVGMPLLVVLHNLIRPERPIKKFADRPTALKRLEGVLEALAKPGQVIGTIAPANADGSAGDTTTKTVKAGALKGKTIRFIQATNPRKPGTSGHRSRELAKDGMTVEDFLKAGGIRRDLEWDIAHNWTAVEPTVGYVAPVAEAAPTAPAAPAAAEAAEAATA
jgi:hypothetical protein